MPQSPSRRSGKRNEVGPGQSRKLRYVGDAPALHCLDTWGDIAAQGGGLLSFFLRPAKGGCTGMIRTALLLASTALAVLLTSGAAHAGGVIWTALPRRAVGDGLGVADDAR